MLCCTSCSDFNTSAIDSVRIIIWACIYLVKRRPDFRLLHALDTFCFFNALLLAMFAQSACNSKSIWSLTTIYTHKRKENKNKTCRPVNHIHGLYSMDKMAATSQTTFPNAFSWMHLLYFDSNFTGYVSKGPIDNKPALVQVMAWRRTGDKSLPEPKLTQFNELINEWQERSPFTILPRDTRIMFWTWLCPFIIQLVRTGRYDRSWYTLTDISITLFMTVTLMMWHEWPHIMEQFWKMIHAEIIWYIWTFYSISW